MAEQLVNLIRIEAELFIARDFAAGVRADIRLRDIARLEMQAAVLIEGPRTRPIERHTVHRARLTIDGAIHALADRISARGDVLFFVHARLARGGQEQLAAIDPMAFMVFLDRIFLLGWVQEGAGRDLIALFGAGRPDFLTRALAQLAMRQFGVIGVLALKLLFGDPLRQAGKQFLPLLWRHILSVLLACSAICSRGGLRRRMA